MTVFFNLDCSEVQRNTKDQEMKEVQAKLDQAHQDFKKMWEFERFDTDYLSSINRLVAASQQSYSNYQAAAPSNGYTGGINRRQNDRF